MTEWKVGDRAMVEIVEVEGDFAAIKAVDGKTATVLHVKHLHPFPAGKTPQEQAVIDAAVKLRNGGTYEDQRQLFAAVDAHLASTAPPDPVAELEKMFNEFVELQTSRTEKRVRAALARVRAAVEDKR